MKALLLLTAVIPAALSSAPAPPPPGAPAAAHGAELSVALSPEAPTVGDRVTAILTLTVPLDQLAGEPRFPPWEGLWGAAEVLAADPAERLTDRAGTATYRQRVSLTAFRPGPTPLPPRPVAVPLAGGPVELTTPAQLAFTVESVLPPLPAEPDSGDPSTAGGAPPPLEPRPPEPPRRLPLGAPFLWTAALLGLAGLGLTVLAWRRRPGAVPAAPMLSPLDELEHALAQVYRAPTPEQGAVLLSMAVRRYLGRQLGFAAPESTTSEIRQRLHRQSLPADLAQGVLQVLAGCDLVKFARQRDEPGRLTERADLAQQLARTLDRHLAPAAEPAS